MAQDLQGSPSPLQPQDVTDVSSPAPIMSAVEESERFEIGGDIVNRNRDDFQLLSIFPQEIWTLILNLVTDTNDFTNVCNSSIFFREILKSRRTKLLFPEVFKVIGNILSSEIHPKPECKLDVPSVDFPAWVLPPWGKARNVPFNYKPSIPSLRSVCPTWTIGVDQFFQHFRHLYDMNLKYGQLDDKMHIDVFCQIDGSLVINKFMTHFHQTHGNMDTDIEDRNPFVGRAVSLCTRERIPCFSTPYVIYHIDRRDRRRMIAAGVHPELMFRTAVTNLLSKYGHHIWYFTMNIEDEYRTRCEYYSILREWLGLMPNLKIIRVIYQKTVGWSVPSVPCNLTSAEVNELQCWSIANPLPKLDNLEFIYTKNLPAPIFRALVGRNNHISMLEIEREVDLPFLDYDWNVAPMKNLTQLSLRIFNEAQFVALMSSEEGWNLSKINLDFKECVYISWNTIYNMLESQWGSTLTNVMIKLPEARDEEISNQIVKESSQLKLNLPFLKSLKVIIPNYSTVDFMLPMKDTLEEFDVTVTFNCNNWKKTALGKETEDGQTIKFLGYFNRLLESNIWTVFPQLKRVEFMETYLESSRSGGYGEVTTIVDYNRFTHTRSQYEWEKIMKEKKAMRKVIKRIKRD